MPQEPIVLYTDQNQRAVAIPGPLGSGETSIFTFHYFPDGDIVVKITDVSLIRNESRSISLSTARQVVKLCEAWMKERVAVSYREVVS